MSPSPVWLAAILPTAEFAGKQIGKITQAGREAFGLGVSQNPGPQAKPAPIDAATVRDINPSVEANKSPSRIASRLKSLLSKIQDLLKQSGASGNTKAILKADGNSDLRIVDGGGYDDRLKTFFADNPGLQHEINDLTQELQAQQQLPYETWRGGSSNDGRRKNLLLSVTPEKSDWQWSAD